MSVLIATAPVSVRRLVESRPPAVSWWPSPPAALTPHVDQPMLELGEPAETELAQPRSPGVRATVVRARWTARPRRDLPDAAEWTGSLVVAVVQTLLGQRPVAQLNRWVADDVLGAVTLHQRRRAGADRGVVRVGLRSLRVQHPHPEVAEVSAHVAVGGTATPVALRLEALGHRWLCTALEVDPRAYR